MRGPIDRWILVNRQFQATRPNQLWVADFTYVATWSGFVYVNFIVDVFSRCLGGLRVARSIQTDRVQDALKQARGSRCNTQGLVQYSDRGSQYLSIRHTERLAETIIGLYKADVIHHHGPWRTLDAADYATLE